MTPAGDPGDVPIRSAEGAADMEAIRELFTEYQVSIGVDLCFQGFDEELRTLPGAYEPPLGCLLLADAGGRIAACIGMRPLAGGVAEMKRLYVRPPWRRRGLGRRLAEGVIAAACRAGHKRMCLDTLDFMTEARTLYESLGFVEIAKYYDNPLKDVVYMERDLETPR